MNYLVEHIMMVLEGMCFMDAPEFMPAGSWISGSEYGLSPFRRNYVYPSRVRRGAE